MSFQKVEKRCSLDSDHAVDGPGKILNLEIHNHQKQLRKGRGWEPERMQGFVGAGLSVLWLS